MRTPDINRSRANCTAKARYTFRDQAEKKRSLFLRFFLLKLGLFEGSAEGLLLETARPRPRGRELTLSLSAGAPPPAPMLETARPRPRGRELALTLSAGVPPPAPLLETARPKTPRKGAGLDPFRRGSTSRTPAGDYAHDAL